MVYCNDYLLTKLLQVIFTFFEVILFHLRFQKLLGDMECSSASSLGLVTALVHKGGGSKSPEPSSGGGGKRKIQIKGELLKRDKSLSVVQLIKD